MKQLVTSFLFLFFTLGVLNSSYAALSPAEDRLVKMMASGELRELKAAAKEIHGRRINNPEVLDVAAEILLNLHGEAWDGQIDTLSWVARALGRSGNGRYHAVLDEVSVGGAHKKLRKHAKKALKELGGAEGTQYKKGMKKVPAKDYT